MRKILIIIIGIVALGVVVIAIAGMYKFNYLASQPGYDVDGNKVEETTSKKDFEIIEVLGESCESDIDCNTPSEYAIQSRCPYDSVCIKNSCTVICPHPFSGVDVDASGFKNATYNINGESVTLLDGLAEKEAVPDSSSKITSRYFGNEVRTDLNDDGREDAVFLLTQETGGSGTFFYVAAALNTVDGWKGSQATYLGDRIAPQTTEVSRNPNHKNVIVVNYTDRAPGEAMTVPPSMAKSMYLKLDTETMQFGEVVADFEGEADPDIMTLDMKPWTWVKTTYNNDTELVPDQPEAFTLTFKDDGSVSVTTDCNNMTGSYELDVNQITFGPMAMTRMFCPDSQEQEFSKMLGEVQSYFFTSKGELVFDLKFDSGSTVFR